MTSLLLRMHHVGFVVQNIESSMPGFLNSMNATWNNQVFHDPIQRVQVAFLATAGSDVQIELVEPCGDGNPVSTFLARGGGIHHVCYEVEDCSATIAAMRLNKALIVKRPQPAVAFGGRHIAWMLTAEKLLIELVELSLKP